MANEHRLVPKHELLSEDEKATFLEKHNLSLPELPEISIDDPAIADMKPKAGDIVKITRDSMTAGQTIFYRRVVTI